MTKKTVTRVHNFKAPMKPRLRIPVPLHLQWKLKHGSLDVPSKPYISASDSLQLLKSKYESSNGTESVRGLTTNFDNNLSTLRAKTTEAVMANMTTTTMKAKSMEPTRSSIRPFAFVSKEGILSVVAPQSANSFDDPVAAANVHYEVIKEFSRKRRADKGSLTELNATPLHHELKAQQPSATSPDCIENLEKKSVYDIPASTEVYRLFLPERSLALKRTCLPSNSETSFSDSDTLGLTPKRVKLGLSPEASHSTPQHDYSGANLHVSDRVVDQESDSDSEDSSTSESEPEASKKPNPSNAEGLCARCKGCACYSSMISPSTSLPPLPLNSSSFDINEEVEGAKRAKPQIVHLSHNTAIVMHPPKVFRVRRPRRRIARDQVTAPKKINPIRLRKEDAKISPDQSKAKKKDGSFLKTHTDETSKSTSTTQSRKKKTQRRRSPIRYCSYVSPFSKRARKLRYEPWDPRGLRFVARRLALRKDIMDRLATHVSKNTVFENVWGGQKKWKKIIEEQKALFECEIPLFASPKQRQS